MSNARIGYGIFFGFGDGASPEVFTNIAEVFDISLPTDTTDLPEATHYQSPNRRKEFISGLIDSEEFTATMNFIPQNATQNASAGLISFQASGVTKNYRITLPAGETVTFAAIVRRIAPALPINDRMTLAVTFKPTGSSTWDLTP